MRSLFAARPPKALLTAGVLVAGLWALVPSSACTGAMNICPCDICPAESAVELSIIEEGTGSPIEDFVVEVVRDGEPQGEPANCLEANREGNRCAFGESPGLYLSIVSAPGYETREALVRVAAEAESELCCQACLSAKPLEVELTPLPFEGGSE